ncbi:MAG: twin-arginine translocase subunit TatC [Ignavibacteriales bacterium CG12_big_fil_rev_8_21_14_0_65_30_8]|nr:MAG: twin-arginine translocase subunit TatC [Ignavibacteriales bacterium CG12_big_fil_rev_8_21_14_0_65_30_8]
MSFLEHLEELRWRLIYSFIGIVIGTILSWIFIDYLINVILLQPAKNAGIDLQNLKPFGQVFVYLEVAIICGLVLSIPNVFYQFWKFIAPGLKEKERKYISSIVVFSSLCFIIGIVFAYFVMLPISLDFASQFGTKDINNQFAINEYLSVIISVMLGAGVVFELPMVTYFLTKIGILTPMFMSKYRKYAIVVILILSAFLTPADIVSQIILAIPLSFLYEFSILISKAVYKKK